MSVCHLCSHLMYSLSLLRSRTGRLSTSALIWRGLVIAGSLLLLGIATASELSQPAAAQVGSQLTASGGAAGDAFGATVALSGDTLLVGAYGAEVGGNQDQGAAYVFIRNGASWTLQQKLTASDGAANDNFGWSVALNGDTAVIGAIGHDLGANADQGAVYVFVRNSSTWAQQQKLTAADGAAGDVLGWSVAVSGETALAGALSHNGAQRNQGAAYVFTRSGTVWNQQQKLTAGDGAAEDAFGTAVALDGNTALVGAADKDNAAQSLQGAAYVFTRSGTSWTQQQKLLASDGAASQNFGLSVALSGDTVLVSAASAAIDAKAAQGAVYVFARSGSTWTQQQKLTASDGAALDNFGAAVALNGPQALVGAPGSGSAQGAAYVFTRSGSVWSTQQKLTAGDGAAGDAFATAAALGNGIAWLGAPGDDQAANADQGSAYVFNLCPVITLSPANLNITTVGVPVSQALTPSGGGAPYSFVISAGALPDGLTLSSGGALTGTPVRAGNFSFTVQVTDAGGCTGSQTYALTLTCPAITLVTTTLPAGTVGAVYPSTALSASGGTAPYSFSVNAGVLPAGLTLTPAGQLSGTPTQAGSFNLTIQAKDANNCAGAQSYTLVTSCPVMTLSPATLPPGVVGTAYSQIFTQSGGNTAVTFSLQGTLPVGLSFTAASATLAGTPTQAGSFPLTLKATDANGCQATLGYTLVLTCPTITVNPVTLAAATVGTAYNQPLTANGGTAPYSFSISGGTLPTGLNLAANGTLSGTPTQAGAYNFTVRAADANGCAGTRDYSITATCPTITLSPTSVPNGVAGTAYSQSFTQTGGSGVITYTLQGTLPTGLSFNAATATLAGTPTQAGSFPFTIKATDANDCVGMQSYTLVLTCPVISLQPTTLPGGTVATAYSQSLTASGGVAPYSFSLSAGTLPNGLSLAANGTLSGTPAQSGTFNFTVRAADANGCAGTLAYTLVFTCPTLTVTPASLPTAMFNLPFPPTTLAANGGISPYSFSLTAGALPTGLTLTNGLLGGTATQTGNFTFSITATDAAGCTGTHAYTLTVRRAAKGDFDGDGKTDLGIWRGTNGQWQIIQSGTGQTQIIAWGRSIAPFFDVIVPGDYDGDGKTDQAIWRGGDSIWYIRRSSDAQPILDLWGANYTPYFDVPTPGDYDGDGKTDLAVFRPSTGEWFIKKSSDGSFRIEAWGGQGDTPIPADYDGDGKTDLAVWRGATGEWLIKRSAGGIDAVPWGAGYAPYFDVPVPADYDGDGKTDLAIWRGADSIWYIRKSSDGQAILDLWGANYAPYNDIPAPGDYDGDGKADLAVWRPTNGTWYVKRSSNGSSLVQVHGQTSDVPVPANGVR